MNEETTKTPPPSHAASRRVRFLIFFGIGLLFALALPLGLTTLLGFDYVTQEAQTRLDNSLQENLVVFATLSTIKAALAIIEGSSVGVAFGASVQLELGDLIQPAFDYLDVTWHIFLYALFILTFYRLLLESGFLSLGLPLIGLGLLGWALFLLWRPDSREWAKKCAFLGLIGAYGIPLALIFSDSLADRYIAPIRTRTVAELAQTETQFSSIKEEFTELRSELSILSPGKSAEAMRNSLTRISEKVSELAWNSLTTFLYYILILSMELLILPILMAYLISSVLRIGFSQLTVPSTRFLRK